MGARHMADYLDTPLVVIGEPSRGECDAGTVVARADRPRQGAKLSASVPHEGVNALEPIARLILGMEDMEMRHDTDLGSSTVVPTLIRTDQISPNVVPGEVWLTCDWRNVPGESGEDARLQLQALADARLPESTAPASRSRSPRTCTPASTGMTMDYPSDNPATSWRPTMPRWRCQAGARRGARSRRAGGRVAVRHRRRSLCAGGANLHRLRPRRRSARPHGAPNRSDQRSRRGAAGNEASPAISTLVWLASA